MERIENIRRWRRGLPLPGLQEGIGRGGGDVLRRAGGRFHADQRIARAVPLYRRIRQGPGPQLLPGVRRARVLEQSGKLSWGSLRDAWEPRQSGADRAQAGDVRQAAAGVGGAAGFAAV